MSQQLPPSSTPRKILLATDLSARSDRALDRATQLANQWGATLVVVHALEPAARVMQSPAYEDLPSWRRPPDEARMLESQIRRDMRETVADLRVFLGEGTVLDVVREAVAREQCDLVIVGAARERGPGHVFLGRTVEQLIRHAPTSVLIVKTRPAGSYRHVLVGTDFTDEASRGLAVAAHWFSDARIAVMHAFDIPYRSLMNVTQLSRDFSAMEHEEIETFVRNTDLPEEVRQRIVTLIEHGPPEKMMRNYVLDRNVDLTVIGTVGRGRLFHVLVGGHAPKIVDATPSDVLVVRAPAEQ